MDNNTSNQTHFEHEQTIANHLRYHKHTRKWYVRLTAYILILTFVSGLTFGAGYLSALIYGDRLANGILNTTTQNVVDQPSTVQIQPTVSDNKATSDISAIASAVSPAIVTISSYSEQTPGGIFGNSNGFYGGTGSGITFKMEGEELFIVTNYHVIEGSNEIEVIFHEGTTVVARVLGYDSNNDLAVLSIDTKLLKGKMDQIVLAPFGDSETIQIGELAVAIGNPLGPEYASTVTAGIISALNREIYINRNTSYVNLIQTDAAINPGNSGGALLNGRGEVIGINSAKYVDTGVEGIGFAIPINQAKETIDIVLESRSGGDIAYQLADDRAFLGVQVMDITTDIYNSTGMRFGVYITDVIPFSGAQEAGIQSGDIIYSLNGKKVQNVQVLFDILEKAQVGDTLEVGIIRNDEILTLNAPLYSYKDIMDQQ
ncbi:S1C family serine protease [Petrocella sp. FN5]|uniref:S1C family serine protease n=1 Tax=Petrocella sp. FN5 TaxID=3032002 RepID=UPI0023DBE31B|nr:trypsin-like peptidase domain-containing protein [Petrocella sp. FN5]MDF1616671.1 trypsin-like peptidase domain-containing protein [Petrocella sp. FN5]